MGKAEQQNGGKDAWSSQAQYHAFVKAQRQDSLRCGKAGATGAWRREYAGLSRHCWRREGLSEVALQCAIHVLQVYQAGKRGNTDAVDATGKVYNVDR